MIFIGCKILKYNCYGLTKMEGEDGDRSKKIKSQTSEGLL